MRETSFGSLMSAYAVILFDAYGVLIDHYRPLPHAVQAVKRLNERKQQYFVITNDASSLPETRARIFQSAGLSIGTERIISSGHLLADYFTEHGLHGARCAVLGPEDSFEYVRRAGGEIVPLDAGTDADAMIIGDQSGFDFWEGVNNLLNAICRCVDAGRAPTLLLANPDIIYPDRDERIAFASGSVAVMIEAGLAARYPGKEKLVFTRLGKPYAPLFHKAESLTGTRNLVMLGDQLLTDIKGANDYGIDSALVLGGVTDRAALERPDLPQPTWLLPSLA